jgi:predicted ester cyclase
MSSETNCELVRRWIDEVVNAGNPGSIHQLARSDLVNHVPRQGPGLEGVQEILDILRGAFPDVHFTAEAMIADGDKVAVRFTITGTHTNLVVQDVPPTGKRFAFSGIQIFRVQDGQIAESWGAYDELGLYQQIGAIPLPGQTASG